MEDRGTFGTIGKIIKYSCLSLVLILPSVIAFAPVFAADTGGYPWADAEIIDHSTYDWGYRDCPNSVRRAGACTAHNRYKWGVKYYLSDPWRYDVRNCTSYVAWRVNRDYGLSITGWGNANNWDNATTGRYTVDNTPTAGDIAVWEGLYGHVAFVTKVYPNGMFEVDQYNSDGTGQFSHQLRSSADHFIHVKPQAKSIKPKEQVKSAAVSRTPAKPPAKQKPVRPAPPSIAGSLVPKPGASDVNPNSPMPSTKEIEYQIEYAPNKEQINVFAVRHTYTKSGKIEVNQSSIADRNTRFGETKITSIPVRGEGQTEFVFADYNKDRILDLYVILVQATKSKKTEVKVLDGSTDYKRQLANNITQIPTHEITDVSYKVADKNNDRRPDLFKITNPNYKQKTKFEVLDGSKAFIGTLDSWSSEESTGPSSQTNYFVGDHDGDGRVDIYQSVQNSSNNGQASIQVFEAKTGFKVPSRKWLQGKIVKRPSIILPVIKIEEEIKEVTDKPAEQLRTTP